MKEKGCEETKGRKVPQRLLHSRLIMERPISTAEVHLLGNSREYWACGRRGQVGTGTAVGIVLVRERFLAHILAKNSGQHGDFSFPCTFKF